MISDTWLAKEYLATKDPIEAESLSEDHKNECTANHEGSSGKMEVDSVSEMFKRSEEHYGLKYMKYIGQTARNYVDTVDNARILRAKKTTEANSKEARTYVGFSKLFKMIIMRKLKDYCMHQA
ncbi:PREDICTED: uncharacterized protein LOC107066621 [Polistes dominula]|uniref:Uncharacterized protein LOC107066621 n=1 Tax=Polistes dominula TaxID=743375 RepID=A0ABM1I9M3_POLDO|nr:PREDICTED: uncharacterized protein LOC107066621 [Polistes dominula]